MDGVGGAKRKRPRKQGGAAAKKQAPATGKRNGPGQALDGAADKNQAPADGNQKTPVQAVDGAKGSTKSQAKMPPVPRCPSCVHKTGNFFLTENMLAQAHANSIAGRALVTANQAADDAAAAIVLAGGTVDDKATVTPSATNPPAVPASQLDQEFNRRFDEHLVASTLLYAREPYGVEECFRRIQLPLSADQITNISKLIKDELDGRHRCCMEYFKNVYHGVHAQLPAAQRKTPKQ